MFLLSNFGIGIVTLCSFALLLDFMLSSLFLIAYPVILLVYFGARDKKGRVHVMEIQLDKAYPRVPPMVSAVCLLSFWS